MKLRVAGFSTNKKGDLIGTLIALSDDGDPLGFEHTGNFSRIQTRQLFVRRCVEETGHSEEVAQAVLTRVLKRLREGEVVEELPEPKESSRPVVHVSGRFLREITKDAVDAVQAANRTNAEVFVRGGVLVRLHEETGGVVVQPFGHAALKGHLDRLADFVKLNQEGEERPARPPDDVVADFLSLRSLPFPEIRALAGAPVLVSGGRIVEEEGYDAESHVYRYHNNLGPQETLTLNEAKKLLLSEVFGDFPFADLGSQANTLALLFQPFVRHAIDGLVPLYLIDAPARGTGKGLLVDVISEIALGRPAGVMAQPADEDETRKRITSLLLGSHGLVLLDNVRSLRSDALSAVLTAQYWEDRILGRNVMARIENTATWVATGNNVSLSDEMTRRVVPIRLDARMERPEERTGFRHPEILAWVRNNRTRLVSACVAVIQAWLTAGMPRGTATLGRYEAWAGMMEGILTTAGVPGFLSNRPQIYSEADRQTEEWKAFCETWWDSYGSDAKTAKQLFQLAVDMELLIDLRAGRSALAAQQRMGRALANQRDRVFGGWTIRYGGRDGVTRNATYRLEGPE